MVLYERSGEDIDRGLVGHWKLDDLKRIPSDGIIAHYKMNDNTTNTNVIDSKSGNTGTATQNTSLMSATGKISNALSFNGTSDYINIPTGLLNNTTSFSLCGWIKFETNLTVHSRTFAMSDYGSNEGVITGRISESDATYPKQFTLYLGNTRYTFNKVLENNIWYHIVLTHSGTTSKLYVNGVLEETKTTKSFTPAVTYPIDRIGAEDVKYHKGQMDDLRVYDRELSVSEIKTIYGDDGLINHWKLNDNAANKTVIDTRKNIDLTSKQNTSVLHTTGKLNGGLSFNGTSDNLYHGITNIWDGLSSWSYCTWVKPTNTGTGRENLIWVEDDMFILYIDHTDNKVTYYADTVTDNLGYTASVGTLNWNAWNHIALVYDGSNVHLYINGVLDKSSALTGITEVITFIHIGTSFNGGSGFFKGEMDDIRFYNKALNSSQISTLYNSGTGTEETSILATGTETTELFRDTIVAIDRSNFNDGTITGATLGNDINGKETAMFFDGIDDYIQVGLTSDLVMSKGLTISAWIKTDGNDPSGDYKIIVGHESYTRWGIIQEISGQVLFDFDTSGSRNQITITDTTGRTGWDHIVGTYDADTTTSKTYLNGILINTETTGLGDITDTLRYFRIGGNGSNDSFKGFIQKVRVYNRRISGDEVKKLYRLRK